MLGFVGVVGGAGGCGHDAPSSNLASPALCLLARRI